MKTFNKITLFALMSLFFVNCDKFIDEEPISVITSSSFWQSETEATAGIIGAYDRLQTIYRREFGGFIHWTDGRSDVAALGQTDAAAGLVDQIINNNIDPETVGTDWSRLYQAINMSNLAIKNIPAITMNEQLQEELLGEAYFIRAYGHFLATRIWGDVPLRTEPVEDATNLKPSRTARAEVLAQVRSDIENALSRVPTAYGTDIEDKGRATKAAVRALKLDFLLWMARVENSGSADLAEAVTTGASLVNDSKYALLDDFGDIFTVKNNDEVIWSIQYDFASQESGNLGADMTPLSEGPHTGGKMYYQPSEKLKDAFQNAPATDLRAEATLLAFDAVGGATSMFIKYLGSPAQGSQRNFDSNLNIFRLGGVILMYAEALNESGNTAEAITQLNRIRTRAGLPNTTATSQDEVRQAILDEHLVELPFEGSRWFTLIRSGRIAEEVDNVNTNTFDGNSKLLWPVSALALLANENLTQNGAY